MTPTTTVNPASAAPNVTNRPGQVTPVTPPTAPTMAQQANRVVGATLPPNVLAKLQRQKFNTHDVVNQWFHCLLYSETDARKTTTAALFGTPENTRIILVRRKEQLIPLRSLGYQAFLAENWSQASQALMYPEALWPEWANLPDRTLIIDDITELKDMALEDNETVTRADGSTHELQDKRLIVTGAKADIRNVLKSILRKPLHFIVVSMARSWDHTTKEGTISPDLPPSIANLLTSDFEFVFYINTKQWQILTSKTRIASTRKNAKGIDEAYIQTVFAKHKLPLELEGKGILKPAETMPMLTSPHTAGLRAIWEKVKAAGALSPEEIAKLNVAVPEDTNVGADNSATADSESAT